MSIQLKISNSIQSLSDGLCEELKYSQRVFQPIYIVTQTEGMNNWLKQQIADKLGIAANIQFLKPNDFIHLVFQSLGGQYGENISTHDLNWLLYQALNEKEFKQRFSFIAQYYDSRQPDHEIKRMALAEKLADLFDQYQIYRTDYIELWNKNEGEDHWQKWLWVRAKELAEGKFKDKTEIGKIILERLEDPENETRLQYKIPKVYFFGLSLITEYHLDIIRQLAEKIEVHFLIQNPAPEDYWYEDKPEKIFEFLKQKGYREPDEESLANPLLVGWGKIIQDTFMLLFEDDQILNSFETVQLQEPSQQSLLQKIQHSVYHNSKEDLAITETDLNDETVVVNSCFSPFREVEVLYNYLVHLVDVKKADLSARDIVVMVSDIDLYAPYIKAIFDNSKYKFRYSIADESYMESDSISNALVHLLSMNEAQFTSEKVLGLLDFSWIRKNFGLHNLELIRQIVHTAGIRFGFEGNIADDSVYLSWKYGMKRIMYGLCMSGGEEYGEGAESFFPIDAIEGYQMEEAVRLVYFVESLMNAIENRRKNRSIKEWVKYIEECVQIFIGERENNETEDYVLLLNQLERYNLLEDVFDEKISYQVFIHNFLPTLNDARRSHAFASGGITFCSLIPMRSIPFRVVALLGMNFNKFPRKDRRAAFDLMQIEKRRGDRNVKENDKNLFLETLLSAKDYLYISYIGQSLKDKSDFPPSILVDELLDFISAQTENSEEVKKKLIQKHPLHGFSKKYNSGDEKLYSYLLSTALNEHKWLKASSEIVDWDFEEIELNQLVNFYKDNLKTYYNKVLNVYFNQEDLSLQETELFSLDNLQQWGLKSLLLTTENSLSETVDRHIKLGQLPLKNMGKVVIDKIDEEISWVKDEFEALTHGEKEDGVVVDLDLGETRIKGKIMGGYGNHFLMYSFSKNEAKHRFEFYLKCLILSAMNEGLEMHYLSNNEQKIYQFNEINPEEAIAKLKELVVIYQRGHSEMLPFSFDYEIEEGKMKKHTLLSLAIAKITDGYYQYGNEYHINEYNKGYYSDETLEDIFREIVNLVLVEVNEALVAQ